MGKLGLRLHPDSIWVRLYYKIELKIKDLIYKDNSYCIVLFTTRMQFGLLEQVRMLGEVK
jgi:hypothetical protein